jgi:hypothetical protein
MSLKCGVALLVASALRRRDRRDRRQFLVPTSVLQDQGRRAFEVAAPTRANLGDPNMVTTGPPAYRAPIATATATVPHAARVEILATGKAGPRLSISWETTCARPLGKAPTAAVGDGFELQRVPAVTPVTLPKLPHGGHGTAACYLAATAAATNSAQSVHLAIIDY